MTRYTFKVLHSESVDDIGRAVTDHLNDGWELAGQLEVDRDGCIVNFWQPMKKYGKDEITKPDWWDGEK